MLTAAGMLLVFRAKSDQPRIEQVKRAMIAALFEIRLFNDDLPALFRAQGEMLKQNAAYLRLSLVPMLWMIVPIGLIAAQLEFQYGYAGLTPGQPALIKAHLRQASAPAPAAALEGPEGIRVLTSAAWFPATQEIIWRVTPEAPWEYVLNAAIDGERLPKPSMRPPCCSAVAGPRRRGVPESAAVSGRKPPLPVADCDLDHRRYPLCAISGSAMDLPWAYCSSRACRWRSRWLFANRSASPSNGFDSLQRLEAESIHIMREVVAEFEQPGDALFHRQGLARSCCIWPGRPSIPASRRSRCCTSTPPGSSAR